MVGEDGGGTGEEKEGGDGDGDHCCGGSSSCGWVGVIEVDCGMKLAERGDFIRGE